MKINLRRGSVKTPSCLLSLALCLLPLSHTTKNALCLQAQRFYWIFLIVHPSCPPSLLAILQIQPEPAGSCWFIYSLFLISDSKYPAGKWHPQWHLCKPVAGWRFTQCPRVVLRDELWGMQPRSSSLVLAKSWPRQSCASDSLPGKSAAAAGSIRGSSHLGPRF